MFKRAEDMFGPKSGKRRGGPAFGPGAHRGRGFTHPPFGPMGPGGFGPMGRMGGFRAGRGMVEPAILRVLSEKPMHGYEIISTLEEKSHGMWRPSAGSIYPTLQLLEEKGLVKSTDVEGKKSYELTDEGVKENEKHAEMHDEMWEKRAEHLRDFRDSHEDLAGIMHSLRHIMRKGNEAQKEALRSSLKEFRDTIESITEGDL